MLLPPLSLQGCGLTCIQRALIRGRPWHGSGQRRNASLTSAIEGGLRQDGKAFKQAERALRRARTQRAEHDGLNEGQDDNDGSYRFDAAHSAKNRRREARDRIMFLSGSTDSVASNTPTRSIDRGKQTRARARAQGISFDPPLSTHYSHAASEFVYGTWSVLSALKANRRQFYRLYMYCGENGDSNENDPETREIVRLAKLHKLDINRVAGAWDRTLDKMARSKPHNGIVLEASAVPIPRTTALHNVQKDQDEIVFDGKSSSATAKTTILRVTKKRMPLLLWLDQIKDVGNMGAILRSAYYFGVDAVLIPSHNTAPLSNVTVKTSAGCAEHIPILVVEDEVGFMQQCQQNGWLFYAAAATESKGKAFPQNSARQMNENVLPENVLRSNPAVLMMGNEEFGLRAHLMNKAQYPATVPAGRENTVVDSLNVSVATALLLQQFLAKYSQSH